VAFGKFLEQHKALPFDVIIDGLNVSHVTYQKATTQQKSHIVCTVVHVIIVVKWAIFSNSFLSVAAVGYSTKSNQSCGFGEPNENPPVLTVILFVF